MGVDWPAVTANGLLVDKQGGKEERSRHFCVRVRSQTFYPPYHLHLRVFQTMSVNYFLTKHLTRLSCGLSTSVGIPKTARFWSSGWKLPVGSVCIFHLVYDVLFSCWRFKIRIVHLRIIQISSFFYLFFWPRSLWDLSSPTRDWTWAPTVKVQNPNHQATREPHFFHIL